MEGEGAEEDEALRGAAALSREEVLRRRARRVRELARCYRRKYWALVEEVRVKHRDYYWENGKSPLEEEEEEEGEGEGEGEEKEEERLGLGEKGERKRCALSGCKAKAMPLTRFCHPHILSDPRQTLYKACNFVIKSSAQSGLIICGKPVLRAAMPSFCHVHFQRAQKNFAQALKKAGINMPSSSKTVPKFSALIAECVRQIQTKRIEALNDPVEKMASTDAKAG